MKFQRTEPPVKYSDYKRYRSFTRSDFVRTCAYCFRHEDDAGGEPVFEQDHFEPKSRPNVDPSEYRNLYWSCRPCNSGQNKGDHWPNQKQWNRGEVFCDSCQHDPEIVDYNESPVGRLIAKTPAGDFTIRHIRLNDRFELIRHRINRIELISRYNRYIQELNDSLSQIERCFGADAPDTISRVIETLKNLIQGYRDLVQQKPFVISSIPPEIPLNLLREISLILSSR